MTRLGFLVAILIAACSAAPARAAVVFRGDPQAVAEVQAAIQKFLAEPTWRSRIKVASGATVTAEFAAPDRFHVVIPGKRPRDGYVIGKTMWMRLGTACRQVPIPTAYGNPREMMEHSGVSSITVTRAGVESIDNIAVQAYTLVVDSDGKQKQEKLFVDAGTGLPHRIEVPSDRGLVVVTYADYGAPVTVNDPPC